MWLSTSPRALGSSIQALLMGVTIARPDGVHANAAAGVFERQRLRQILHAALADRIAQILRLGYYFVNAGIIQNHAAFTAREKMAESFPARTRTAPAGSPPGCGRSPLPPSGRSDKASECRRCSPEYPGTRKRRASAETSPSLALLRKRRRQWQALPSRLPTASKASTAILRVTSACPAPL